MKVHPTGEQEFEVGHEFWTLRPLRGLTSPGAMVARSWLVQASQQREAKGDVLRVVGWEAARPLAARRTSEMSRPNPDSWPAPVEIPIASRSSLPRRGETLFQAPGPMAAPLQQ